MFTTGKILQLELWSLDGEPTYWGVGFLPRIGVCCSSHAVLCFLC